MDRIVQATINSLSGLRTALHSEAAFRQEIVAFVLSVPLAFLVATDNWTRLLLVSTVLLVLIVELLNTAVEKLADRVTREHDPQIGRVKDMGSAAVGLTLVLAGLVWLLALCERIASLL